MRHSQVSNVRKYVFLLRQNDGYKLIHTVDERLVRGSTNFLRVTNAEADSNEFGYVSLTLRLGSQC